MRKEVRKMAEADIKRIHNNVLAHRPWWMPSFLWVKLVAIVLEPDRGAGE